MDFRTWLVEKYQKDVNCGLRVGQSYLNHVHPGVSMPFLYYETDPMKAWAKIHEIENGKGL